MKNEFIKKITDVDRLAFDWGDIYITCSPLLNNSNNFSAGIVEVQPEGGHDRHNHPGAEEIIFIISGEAEQMIEDENGNPVIYNVSAGSTIFIPESRYHYTKNKSDSILKTFVVYSPHGAEKLLAEDPDCRIIPAKL